ncbi:hypothetical protein MH117_21110 [Paenibacillus sp. ACRRX]|uniref:hypothetical protein n=1 Tax=Paenibacillus sp. ACRRX TaxID=2918206 RepID=UPI001EF6BDB7|nr:hypothetical protein [Paenibacillus sp. ACRRX]MCG7409912.1 hypothetical protein [Paenibacillus sp. ACRRX]
MGEHTRIDWHYSGKEDLGAGTGAYPEEKALGYSGCIALVALLIYLLLTGYVQWNWLQITIAFLLAFDIGGGLVSNSLNSCKRFYHTPLLATESKWAAIVKNKFLFSSFHIHPLVVGLLYGPMNITYGLIWYLLFMTSVVIVSITPLYVKRPVSILIILLAILIQLYAIPPILGFEWLIPLLFLKVIHGHLVREEPYRKAKHKQPCHFTGGVQGENNRC